MQQALDLPRRDAEGDGDLGMTEAVSKQQRDLELGKSAWTDGPRCSTGSRRGLWAFLRRGVGQVGNDQRDRMRADDVNLELVQPQDEADEQHGHEPTDERGRP